MHDEDWPEHGESQKQVIYSIKQGAARSRYKRETDQDVSANQFMFGLQWFMKLIFVCELAMTTQSGQHHDKSHQCAKFLPYPERTPDTS
jgi:hypothetical protein